MAGTFITTIITRDKAGKKLFSFPTCDDCGAALSIADLIPLFSYLYLHARCKTCRKRIPFKYITVEIFAGIYAVIMFYLYNFSIDFFKLLLFLCFAFPISYIDTKRFYIRARLLLLACFLLIAFIFAFEYENLINALLGGLIGFLFFGIVYYFFNEMVNKGEVFLVVLLGLFSGLQGIFWSILLASALGILYSLVWIIIKHHTAEMRIPFSPFLCTGTFLYLIFGNFINKILPTNFL